MTDNSHATAASDASASRQARWRDLALLSEHFGLMPLDFVDKVINIVNDRLYSTSEKLEALVASIQGTGKTTTLNMAQFEMLMENSIDTHFDKFEVYALKSVFSLPANMAMTLPHYRDIDYTLTREQELALDKELEQTRQTLLQAINAELKRRTGRLNPQAARAEQLRKELAFLTEMAQERNVAPLGEHITFVVDQAHALDRLVAETRQVVEDGRLNQLPTQRTTRDAYLDAVARAGIADREALENELQASRSDSQHRKPDSGRAREHAQLLSVASLDTLEAMKAVLDGGEQATTATRQTARTPSAKRSADTAFDANDD
ncbi:Mis12 protein-domain-containing protein [Thamnocephalis sphaerospora]|uniref:Mis12 protein-domain-containing protein n=1 Tax=Thamnocephalis sphaerospora TaxID=78915 RepID=A0A4P9XK67_9FUNG|nr:Mis12 protein-domain-containing protein [Thamnocephalis sphaerospora]|eukprot:RKP06136.1 Mis12 protein-domain-containing protein [Thamnocephalis sphaerospora]